ncbi:hypothetical protein ACET3Z_000256 [Daucus carota]
MLQFISWTIIKTNLMSIFDVNILLQAKALEAAMNDINNSFGKGAVTRLGNAGGSLVDSFPSGCLTLDIALGVGLPRGNIVEVCFRTHFEVL